MLALSRSHRTGRRADRTAAATTAARSATLLSGEHRCCSLRAVQFSKCFLCQRRVRFITDFPPVKRVSTLAVGRKRRSDISRAVNAGLRTAVRKHERDLRAAHIHCGTVDHVRHAMDGQRIARGHGIRRRNRDWLGRKAGQSNRQAVDYGSNGTRRDSCRLERLLDLKREGLCLGLHIVTRFSACQSDRACGVRPDFGPAAVLDYDSKRISVHRANRFCRDQLRRTIIIENTLAVPFYLNRLRLYVQHAFFVCNFVIFGFCIHRNNRVGSNIAKLRIVKRIVQTRKHSFVLIVHESVDFCTIIT